MSVCWISQFPLLSFFEKILENFQPWINFFQAAVALSGIQVFPAFGTNAFAAFAAERLHLRIQQYLLCEQFLQIELSALVKSQVQFIILQRVSCSGDVFYRMIYDIDRDIEVLPEVLKASAALEFHFGLQSSGNNDLRCDLVQLKV